MNNEFYFTKKTLLNRVNNDMTSYREYYVNFRVYTDNEKSRFYRLAAVLLIYDDDIFEYNDADTLSKKDYNNTINELIAANIEGLVDSANNIDELFDSCNDTINNYNKHNHSFNSCLWF